LTILYEFAVERKVRDMKFSAVLHGADPKEIEDAEMPTPKNIKDNLLFGDPADYANMPEDTRKELSEKMRAKYFKFAGVKDDGR
jgi:hypothetical protein